ncbi:hypothetical protein QQG55_27695 [Brugia pahangi]
MCSIQFLFAYLIYQFNLQYENIVLIFRSDRILNIATAQGAKPVVLIERNDPHAIHFNDSDVRNSAAETVTE